MEESAGEPSFKAHLDMFGVVAMHEFWQIGVGRHVVGRRRDHPTTTGHVIAVSPGAAEGVPSVKRR